MSDQSNHAHSTVSDNATHARVLIVGSGPAGYTAAIYAARAMLEPVMVSGIQPGGQLTITTEVENYPGFADPIQGPWLMEQMRAQAENVGTTIVADHIAAVDLATYPFRLTGDGGHTYLADALIVATGAQAKWLGLDSEEAFKGYGVSACATCDGFFFRDRQVAVVGGGNTAAEEALFLTKFATTVHLIHRRDALRAEKILQQRLFAHDRITIHWDTTLIDVLGQKGHNEPPVVTGARLRDVKSGQTRDLAVDGIFIAIGHKPATSLFVDKLAMKRGGYLITKPGTTRTSVPGVFAAGDVSDDIYRQAVTAAGMGCMAALEAEQFLADPPFENKSPVTAVK